MEILEKQKQLQHIIASLLNVNLEYSKELEELVNLEIEFIEKEIKKIKEDEPKEEIYSESEGWKYD